MVITPVAEVYEMPVPPESDVELILLLKVVKSVALRNPFCESVAWEMAKAPVLELYDKGAEALKLVEEILLLKLWKSVDESAPLFVAEAVGRLKVMVLLAAVMVKSVPVVEVASI